MKLLIVIILCTCPFLANANERLDNVFKVLDFKIDQSSELFLNRLSQNVDVKIDESKIWMPIYLSGGICLTFPDKRSKKTVFQYQIELVKKTESWIPLFAKRIKNSYWKASF